MNYIIKIITRALLIIIGLGLHGCKNKHVDANNTSPEILVDSTQANPATTAPTSSFVDIYGTIAAKNTPVIDTTNFDNLEEHSLFSKQEIDVLMLEQLYPNFYKAGYNYKAKASYKLNISDNYYSVVFTILKGDSEMESVLVNYDNEYQIIASKVISYDEIAEGWSKKFSKLEKSIITVIDELYLDNLQSDTTKFHINKLGEINQIKSKFSSKIKPDKTILLNQVYTDTIAFSSFNDEGDYPLLFGEKDGAQLSLLYKKDLTKDANYFKQGDLIEVKWKMDSIWLAGDGETLDFKEAIIKVSKIAATNTPLQFLWRADVFDQEINQYVNTIIINDTLSKSITPQEKAALAYVSFDIGSDCWWDGKATKDRSNLACKIATSLDLGYQCSDKQLGFLRKWFLNDDAVLKQLKKCRTIPYTATQQTTFDQITIVTDDKNETITVSFKAHGLNLRESSKWSWTQIDSFKYTDQNITLTGSKKSKVIWEEIELGED